VTPDSHERVAWENRHWIVHSQQGGNACASGFVWRDAFPGDRLCVTRETREAVREENRLAGARWQLEGVTLQATLEPADHRDGVSGSEQLAHISCPQGSAVVWLSLPSGKAYYAGNTYFGATGMGVFVCRARE
jgi:hypothetical protein